MRCAYCAGYRFGRRQPKNEMDDALSIANALLPTLVSSAVEVGVLLLIFGVLLRPMLRKADARRAEARAKRDQAPRAARPEHLSWAEAEAEQEGKVARSRAHALMIQHFIFRNYWWIGLLIGAFAAGSAYFFGGGDRVGLVGAAIAGTLGFYYFVQQQKLAETQLFHNLFTAFNARYDKLNGPLAKIACQSEGPLPESDRNLIVDYFNLCAEEYLFYKEGYIHRDAWRSWCRGMLWYLRHHPFRDVWNNEVETDSFYGLSLDVIKQGAA